MKKATAGPYWSWGYVAGSVDSGSAHNPNYAGASVSASPWVAGYAWTPYGYGWCYTYPYCYSAISTYPLYWSSLQNSYTGNQVCANSSNPVYSGWAAPLGYCQPNAGTGVQEFSAPSNPIQMQGLLVSSCVFVFLAAVGGCMDAGSIRADRAVATCAACTSLIAMVLLM